MTPFCGSAAEHRKLRLCRSDTSLRLCRRTSYAAALPQCDTLLRLCRSVIPFCGSAAEHHKLRLCRSVTPFCGSAAEHHKLLKRASDVNRRGYFPVRRSWVRRIRTPTWQTLYRTRCPFPEEAVQYQPGGPCSTTTMPATFSLLRDDHHHCTQSRVRHLRRRHRRRSPQRRVLPRLPSLDRFTELPQRLPSRVHSTSRPSRPLTRRPPSREPLQAFYRRPVSTPSSSPSSTGSPR